MKVTAALVTIAPLLLRVLGQQFTPNLEFNITVNTMSGHWDWSSYEIFTPINLANGIVPWVSLYTGMLDMVGDFVQGMIGQGVPLRIVSGQWYNPQALPSFLFTFPGRGWELTGSWAPWNASITKDDIEIRADGSYSWLPNPVDDLGGQSQLAWGMHSVNYTVRDDYSGGGNFTVGNLTMMTGMVSDKKTFEEVPKTVVNFVENGQPNPAFLYDGPPGAWQVTNELGGWGGQAPISYTQLVGNYSVEGRLALVIIPIPINTSFVVVNGTMGPNYNTFGALWDPVPSIGKSPVAHTPNSVWVVPNAMLLFQPLNPQVQTNLTIAVLARPVQGIGLTSITFYSGPANITNANGTMTADEGAVIGGAVGGAIGGILLLALLAFCCMRKRKNDKKARAADISRFEVDETANNPTPFLVQPSSAMSSSAQPSTVQTYTVQANQGGGYTTGGFAAAGYTDSPHSGGYSPNELSTPTTGPNMNAPLLASLHRNSNPFAQQGSDYDETSSVSPSMSASAVGTGGVSGAESKASSSTPFAAFGAPHGYAQTNPQGYPVPALDEKGPRPGYQQPGSRALPIPTPGQPIGPGGYAHPAPGMQELDGGAIDQYGTVPPVYNPTWADRRESGSSTGQMSPGHRHSVDDGEGDGWKTPREH